MMMTMVMVMVKVTAITTGLTDEERKTGLQTENSCTLSTVEGFTVDIGALS